MGVKRVCIMILTSYKLEEMSEAWRCLESDMKSRGEDCDVWLANDSILINCERDLKKYFGIGFENDWLTNPQSVYRQKLLEALHQDNVFMPKRDDGRISYMRAREGIDFDVTLRSGFADIKPRYDLLALS
jgi:hypothetical protein